MSDPRQHIMPVYRPPEQVFEKGEGVCLFTEDGTRYLDFIAGIAVNAPHPDEARELIAFFFSDTAQRMFAEMTNEIPVMPDVEWENPTLEAMMPFVADERNVSELGDHNATAQRIFDRVGWQ